MRRRVWKTAVHKRHVSCPCFFFFFLFFKTPSTEAPALLRAPPFHLNIFSSAVFFFVVWTPLPSWFSAGEVPFNHEILREANALCHRLPVLSTVKFKTDFYDVSERRVTAQLNAQFLLFLDTIVWFIFSPPIQSKAVLSEYLWLKPHSESVFWHLLNYIYYMEVIFKQCDIRKSYRIKVIKTIFSSKGLSDILTGN